MAFPTAFHPEDCNLVKKRVIEDWILSNVDYTRLKDGFPVCFHRDVSFYFTSLHYFQGCSLDEKRKVLSSVLDSDVRDALEASGIINWCCSLPTVLPVNVSRDGNCFLHSVATAIWGISDKRLLLRHMLGLTLKVNVLGQFHSRWSHHRKNQIFNQIDRLLGYSTESSNRPPTSCNLQPADDHSIPVGLQMPSTAPGHVNFKGGMSPLTTEEWSEITDCLDMHDCEISPVPCGSLRSIHVYAMANIIRRPIIVVSDPVTKTVDRLVLQDRDMAGIYLPLEWGDSDTHTNPILIGYSCCHFAPLLLADCTGCAIHVPLVTRSLQQLPVRFLLESEEPMAWELLMRYLQVTEVQVQEDDVVHCVPCAKMKAYGLPDRLNIMLDFFDASMRGLEQERVVPTQEFAFIPGETEFGCRQPTCQMEQSPLESGQTIKSEKCCQAESQTLCECFLGQSDIAGQNLIHIPPPSFVLHDNIPCWHHEKRGMSGCGVCGGTAVTIACNNRSKHSHPLVSTDNGIMSWWPIAHTPMKDGHNHSLMMSELCSKGCGLPCFTASFPCFHECFEKHLQDSCSGAITGCSSAVTPSFVSSQFGTVYVSSPSSGMATMSTECHPCMNFPDLPSANSGKVAIFNCSQIGHENSSVLPFSISASIINNLSRIFVSKYVSVGAGPTEFPGKEHLTDMMNSPIGVNPGTTCVNVRADLMTQSSVGKADDIGVGREIQSSPQLQDIPWPVDDDTICAARLTKKMLPSRVYRVMDEVPSLDHASIESKVCTCSSNVGGLDDVVATSFGSASSALGSNDHHKYQALCSASWSASSSTVTSQDNGQHPIEGLFASAPPGFTDECRQCVGKTQGERTLVDITVPCRRKKCAADMCQEMVEGVVQLCEKCKSILNDAHGRQVLCAEAVGSSPCLTDGCQYYGSLDTLGYCSQCFGWLVQNQAELESRCESHAPRIVDRPFPSQSSFPLHHGLLCQHPTCSICHMKSYDSTRSSKVTTRHRELCGVQQAGGVSSRSRAPSHTIPDILTTLPQNLGHSASPPTIETRGIAQPPVCVTTSSGSVTTVRRNVGGAYGRPGEGCVKCLRPGCSNYGNRQKRGLCGQCTEESRLSDEDVRYLILGEDQIG